MQLTSSFGDVLQPFVFVFTAPTFETFVQILTGWTLSQRHRFLTDIIFSSGNVGNGHWSRYHDFFSRAAWDIDHLSLLLARLVVQVLCPGSLLLWAVDDTLCRKRGLTLFGAGMHHDPLISSKAKPLVSWGHDWVVLSLVVVGPFWAPHKVFALPMAMRLYRNRQGLTKGNKGKTKGQQHTANPNHRTRPELAVELISLLSTWLPDHEHVVVGDSAYGGHSVLAKLPQNVHLISQVHPKGALYRPAPPRVPGTKGAPRKKGERLPTRSAWADDTSQPWTELKFDQFGLHTTLATKTQQALYYKAGGQRLLTIVLTRDRVGQRPDHWFYCTKLDWEAQHILSAYSRRWAIECTFENCKQHLGFEDPANRVPKAVERTAPLAGFLYSLIVVWFHQEGHKQVRFPDRPWYRHKSEPSFADLLTTLRRLSYEDIIAQVVPKPYAEETKLTELIELLSRAG